MCCFFISFSCAHICTYLIQILISDLMNSEWLFFVAFLLNLLRTYRLIYKCECGKYDYLNRLEVILEIRFVVDVLNEVPPHRCVEMALEGFICWKINGFDEETTSILVEIEDVVKLKFGRFISHKLKAVQDEMFHLNMHI